LLHVDGSGHEIHFLFIGKRCIEIFVWWVVPRVPLRGDRYAMWSGAVR
jgi:hypothetical protein